MWRNKQLGLLTVDGNNNCCIGRQVSLSPGCFWGSQGEGSINSNSQKYMIPPRTRLISVKNQMMSLKVIARAGSLSIPTLAVTNALSSSVNQLAMSGKSEMEKYATTPIMIVKMPSRMKTHLQLLRPPRPSMLAIAVARRLPKALATRTEE